MTQNSPTDSNTWLLIVVGLAIAISMTPMAAAQEAGPGDVTGDGQPALDPDGDGLYEDVDGNGEIDSRDVYAVWELRHGNHTQYFDFHQRDGGETQVDARDVLELWLNEVGGS